MKAKSLGYAVPLHWYFSGELAAQRQPL
jgi:hypothetical protein